MSLGRRINPTHTLSATRSGEISCSNDDDCPPGSTCVDGVCVDDYGTALSGESDLIGGSAGDPVAVRFHIEGVSLTRTTIGETVDRSPAVEAPPGVGETLREGDTLALTPLADTEGGPTIDDLEVQAIRRVYSRRARPPKVVVETDDL